MADHPSTFSGETAGSDTIAWDDRASLISATADAPLGQGGATLLRGSFAEMIRHITHLPAADRARYVIRKAGDRTYTADEAMALASKPGFPADGII